MRRTKIPTDENPLFDFPLGPAPGSEERTAPDEVRRSEPAEDERPPRRPRKSKVPGQEPASAGARPAPPDPTPHPDRTEAETATAEPLPLFGAAKRAEAEAASHPDPPRSEAGPAGLLVRRLAAGAIDLGVFGTALGCLIGGVAVMGLPLRLWQAPAYGLVLGLFSFLYLVLSLAFWGQTPGMAYQRLRAQTDDGRPLTFGQAGLRWIGGTATVLLLGLPALLALRDGGSLADRVSGSELVDVGPRAHAAAATTSAA